MEDKDFLEEKYGIPHSWVNFIATGDTKKEALDRLQSYVDRTKTEMENFKGSIALQEQSRLEIEKLTEQRSEKRKTIDEIYADIEPNLTANERAIFNYRQTYYQRGLKEMIRLRALDGTSEKFRIPLPKTVAYFETWISGEEGEAFDLEGYDFGDDAEL